MRLLKYVDELCGDYSCDTSVCIKRHPKQCKFYKYYNRCKFNPCKYSHTSKENEKMKEIDEKVCEIEDLLKNKIDIGNKIKIYDEKINSLENTIKSLEVKIMNQNEIINEITKRENNVEKHQLSKKNILQRIEDIEISNAEKDKVIEYLTEKVKHLEEKSQEIEISS